MKKKFFLLLVLTTFLLSGCSLPFLDPYRNPKYGEMAVDSWFKDKSLGKLRKKAERIDKIVKTECSYVENSGNKYVFKCKLTITEQGETVIPLSKHETRYVYTVFIKEKDNKYKSVVYNSKYSKNKEKIWKEDKNLNY